MALFFMYSAPRAKHTIQEHTMVVEKIAAKRRIPELLAIAVTVDVVRLFPALILTEFTIYVGNEVGCSVGRTLGCDEGRQEG